MPAITADCPQPLLTLSYRAADGNVVPNPIDRYALGDRDPLQFAPDGSLTIHVQPTSPSADKESNWLPSPAVGTFSLTLRLYMPKPQVLDGTWLPPPLQKVS